MHDIEVQTPDVFIVNQITLHQPAAVAALRRMRLRWNNPKHTPESLIALFEDRGMPLTAVHLLHCL